MTNETEALSRHSPGAGAPCTAAGTCSTSCGRTSAAWSALAWCSISRTAVRASGPNVWRSTDTNRTNRSDQREWERRKKTTKDQHRGASSKQAITFWPVSRSKRCFIPSVRTQFKPDPSRFSRVGGKIYLSQLFMNGNTSVLKLGRQTRYQKRY